MGFSLGSLFKGSNLTKSLLTGGVSTAHELNMAGKKKLFPDKPPIPEAPPAPTLDAAQEAGEDQANQLRRRRGMAATVLGGMDNLQPTTQTASLLGN
jgi:hypothetical protein